MDSESKCGKPWEKAETWKVVRNSWEEKNSPWWELWESVTLHKIKAVERVLDSRVEQPEFWIVCSSQQRTILQSRARGMIILVSVRPVCSQMQKRKAAIIVIQECMGAGHPDGCGWRWQGKQHFFRRDIVEEESTGGLGDQLSSVKNNVAIKNSFKGRLPI